MKLYNIIAFVPDNKEVPKEYVKYRNVNNLERLHKFLDRRFPTWKFYNLYEKESKEYLKTVKKEGVK